VCIVAFTPDVILEFEQTISSVVALAALIVVRTSTPRPAWRGRLALQPGRG
jgi:hypothetical protein